MSLLQTWQKILSEGADDAETSVVESKTNGDAASRHKDEVVEKKEDETMDENATPADLTEPTEAPVETKAELGNSAADEATDGDVDMTDSRNDKTYEPPTGEATTGDDAEMKTDHAAAEETQAE